MSPPPARRAEDTPDDELVEAARTGDRVALEHLLRRHHDRILVLCRRLCRDRQDAEDATQDALIAIVKGLQGFRGGASFTTWSYRVAANACLDELRRRGRRPLPVEDPPEPRGGGAGSVADPLDAAVDAERRGQLQRALDRLPDEFRQAVVLRDLAQLDYAEIADLLGLAPGTVRSRISRGRARLSELLSDEGATGNPGARGNVRHEDPP